MNKLTQSFPENCFPMMGLHPCSVKENFEEEHKLEEERRHKEFLDALAGIGIGGKTEKTIAEKVTKLENQPLPRKGKAIEIKHDEEVEKSVKEPSDFKSAYKQAVNK